MTGCATAAEDPYAASPFGTATKDGAVAETAAPPAKDSSVTPSDSGSPAADTSSPADTFTDPDTGSTPDTSVPDTWIDPDTGVFDTGTPPLDTGPTGGMCNWCSTGSCSSLFVDYACLLDCLSAGHADCDYDPTKSMPCTCVD